ncbi:hypothetical protein CHLRE_01g008700v5 [Chlamydomonas reinhardtii]|uniref:Uncharacterized protein n=1 Tax=Chlamydomonas reinhardtii TaxID=3055 RepID=A0A2K3E594_CHLRE|nr:uncharacterized protein CHLRE_01g008700v5 [Chlamydomonas reinhardtii]PNW87960.1 hypothetical protein CHLRE_01g008700v5 [Chlamydomonas reinhardtii]
MEPILDALTASPNPQLFELDPPRYTSAFGRRTDAVFKANVPPAPMLFSQDQGLVLYERVISTKAENQLLQKLTKPKFYHHAPIVPAKKGEGSPRRGAANSSLAAAQHSAPPPQHHHHHHPLPSARHASPHGHSTATHHATGHPRSAPASRPGSATGGGSGGAGAAGPPGSAGAALTSTSGPGVGTHRPASGRSRVLASTPPEGSARAQEAGKQAVAAAAAAAAAPGTQPGAGQRHRRSRSMSPGQAAAAAAAGGAGGGRAPHRKPLYPEDGPLKDYFSKERASVTATTVFTWGNRYKIGAAGAGSGVSGALGAGGGGGGGKKSGRGGGGGGSDGSAGFTSYMPTQHKPPLRL